MKKYIQKVWLNSQESPSTGSVCVFDGLFQYKSTVEPVRDSFVEIKDCHGGIRLHRCYEDTEMDFINKVEKLRNTLDDFLSHLKSKIEGTDRPAR